MSQTFRLKGIEEPIEIFRDSFGVPHIWARTAHDAFFGQGWVSAQDRLWHMEYDRRRAYGRLAELIGPAGLDLDIYFRTMGLKNIAALELEKRAKNTDPKLLS
jgi:penicillin amidase